MSVKKITSAKAYHSNSEDENTTHSLSIEDIQNKHKKEKESLN